MALVKPQFEAAPREVPKGVVRATSSCAAPRSTGSGSHAGEVGFEVLGEVESPLVGPAGNHEFFLHLRWAG